VSVYVCVRGCVPALLHGPGCDLGDGRGCPLAVHCADLQLVYGFRCYNNVAQRVLTIDAHDSTAANAKCQRVLVLALCLVHVADVLILLAFKVRTRCIRCGGKLFSRFASYRTNISVVLFIV